VFLSVIIDYTTVLLQTSRVNKSICSYFVVPRQHPLLALVHSGVQVDEDVDACDDNFGGDEDDDDPLEILACWVVS
jgi:hypothetical protein